MGAGVGRLCRNPDWPQPVAHRYANPAPQSLPKAHDW